MDITRENLKLVKEEILKKIIQEEELNKIKENIYNESKEIISKFNDSNNEGDFIDE